MPGHDLEFLMSLRQRRLWSEVNQLKGRVSSIESYLAAKPRPPSTLADSTDTITKASKILGFMYVVGKVMVLATPYLYLGWRMLRGALGL